MVSNLPLVHDKFSKTMLYKKIRKHHCLCVLACLCYITPKLFLDEQNCDKNSATRQCHHQNWQYQCVPTANIMMHTNDAIHTPSVLYEMLHRCFKKWNTQKHTKPSNTLTHTHIRKQQIAFRLQSNVKTKYVASAKCTYRVLYQRPKAFGKAATPSPSPSTPASHSHTLSLFSISGIPRNCKL